MKEIKAELNNDINFKEEQFTFYHKKSTEVLKLEGQRDAMLNNAHLLQKELETHSETKSKQFLEIKSKIEKYELSLENLQKIKTMKKSLEENQSEFMKLKNDLIEMKEKMNQYKTFLTIFFKIGLPLSKPAIAAQAIFWFVGIWNDFFGPSIYLTNPKVQTLQVYLNSLLSSNASGVELPILMAGSVLASLPMIVIFFCFQNFFINSIALSGMKE